MDKDSSSFIAFDNFPVSYQMLSENDYQKVLDIIPTPISLWKLNGDDFNLVFLNKAAKINDHRLYTGIQLSIALPEDYKRVFHKISPSDKNYYSYQKVIDKDLLIITIKPFKQKKIKNPQQKDVPFSIIVEKTPVSIIVTDIHGDIEYVNPAFLTTTGYSIHEVVGKNPRILKSGNKSREEYKELWDTILSGNVWKGEFINKRKNGEIFYEYSVITPIKDNNGNIKNFIAVKEDITKLKKAREELKANEKLAAIGKMATYISHEIKTPLTSIKINVDLLEKKTIDIESKKSLLLIQKEIKRLTHLLKNVLQYSYHSSSSFLEINLYNKIESIKEFLKPMLKENGVVLFNKTAEHTILGNPQQLRSLFLHLIENSIEAMDKGGEIEITSEIKEGNCYIYIKDNGCGIECPNNIFNPFFTTKSIGTGLGLPIVKNIVDQHEGSINLISSRPGETIFEIVFKTRGTK